MREPIHSSHIPDGYSQRHGSYDSIPDLSDPNHESTRSCESSDEDSTQESDDPVALGLQRAIDTVRQERRAMLQRFSKIDEEIKSLQREFDGQEE